MAAQPRLLTPTFQLDRRSREAGRRGVAKARAALAEALASAASERLAAAPSTDHHRLAA